MSGQPFGPSRHATRPCCFILPPDVLARLAEEGSPEQREAAMKSVAASASLRSRRSLVSQVVQELDTRSRKKLSALAPPPGERKTVYDVQNGGDEDLPGVKKRGEGDRPTKDDAVNEAYDNADMTYDFYKDVLKRNSIDDRGMELISSVHFGTDFDNAFWNGSQMVYGDCSGEILARGSLTRDIAVVAHEITHGVTQYTAGLRYSKQSGALNESFSDVVGSLVKQYAAKEAADEADWLIGEGVLGTALQGVALRSMKAPGTAFNFDNQPAHMDDYMDLPDDNNPRNDNGGVHINSGIPNKAFYLAAIKLGGHSWEEAGPIWYDALKNLTPNSQFKDAAKATIASAGALFGKRKKQERAVREAWKEVGVL